MTDAIQDTARNLTLQSRPETRKMTKNTKEIDVRYFIDNVLETGMRIPGRIAAALNYCAEAHPKKLVPYNILHQMVMGFAKASSQNSKDVESIRTKMTGATRILHEVYGRGKHSVPGVGVRATVDSADRLATEVVRKRGAAGAAVRSLTKSMGAIEIKEVPNTPELREHRDWFVKNSKHILEESNDLVKRLLPESTGEKK
jgi:hypothetical protein